ncbi:DUF5667 domain-containing protein [Lentzea flava]|uniref:DUF5667 domain-containing protein n=1 Tax=Lentzea flava TaxID=103732 RepID=A0ABQ2UH55_9PSEU|nr:DUF5667 domain-containing protein [Lentzea flava]MCP2198746.1 hypothetical protein [Lentzea flava]GGU29757.1 hypothetical protein GCM10010178_22560 [Lentzea flava]
MDGKGSTPRWRHTEHERFARAVEGGPQPVGRDSDLADDLAIVALLRGMDVGPDAETRARMKQRILTAPPPEKPLVLSSVRRVGARARLAVAAAAVLCLLMSLGGMSVLLSRDALPGDPLYGVKRTTESASLGLTFDDESRALKHLEFAASRVSEMETLADRAADQSAQLTALADLNTDAVEGARQFTTYATSSDEKALPALRDWALAQYVKLGTLRPRLPGDAGAHADTTMWLLASIAQRAHDLAARAGCAEVVSGSSDKLGPLPSRDECASVVTDPNSSGRAPSSVQPTPSGQPSSSSASSTQPTQSVQPGTGVPPVSQPGTSTPPASDKPGITIPLPLPLPSISLPLLPGISFG